jgi:hypothetical protein
MDFAVLKNRGSVHNFEVTPDKFKVVRIGLNYARK